MKIAYFVNQYALPSCTFIRREIRALEADGVSVVRFAARRPDMELKDPADREECDQTRYLLEAGAAGLLTAGVRSLLRRPVAFWSALRIAWRLGGRNERGRLVHLIYVCQAALLKEWLAEAEVSHVHGHFGTNTAAVLLLARTLGAPPYSFTVHGPDEFDDPRGLSLGDKIAGSSFTVAISNYGRSQLWRWADYAHWNKVKVVHCGVDDIFLRVEPTPVPAALRLVCIGRISEQKGHGILVDAVRIAAKTRRDFEIRVLGDGPLRPEIEKQIAEHGLEELITLVGWASNTEVRDEILGARAMILPSFAEGLPVVIMESLALGRPVLTTTIAGIPELVTEPETGWLVPAGSPDRLAEALLEVLEAGPDALSAMGTEGARRVHERHNVSTEARKLRALIEESGAGTAVE